MKIYIETDMTEMPKCCEKCKTGCNKFNNALKTNAALLEAIEAIDNGTRLKNCPLHTETEIADKAKEKENGKNN